MTSQLAFDGLAAGRQQRDEGLARLEAKAEEWVWQVRHLAREICRQHGSVTTDDLRELFTLPEGLHLNTWGCILRRPYFAPFGTTQTKRSTGHARWIHRWVAVGDW